MKFLMKYPTRARPELFKRCVDRWQLYASDRNEFHWRVSVDLDDPSMNTQDIADFAAQRGLDVVKGYSTSKIDAVNRDMDNVDYDALILVSDDMLPQVENWDLLVEKDIFLNNSDCKKTALWYPDGFNEQLCTLSIFTRDIYEEFKYIYHPQFVSLFADDFFTAMMNKRGYLRKCAPGIFRHEWMHYNNDRLMARNEAFKEHDRKTWERLKLEFEL